MFESEFERELYGLRQQKLRQIEALGQPAYPNSFAANTTVSEVQSRYSASTAEQLDQDRVAVQIAGRLMQLRLQGKAGFAQLQQGGQRLQIYVRKDNVGEQGFELFRLLDLGDHVGVEGYLFRTRTGELTVHVEKLTFLAEGSARAP